MQPLFLNPGDIPGFRFLRPLHPSQGEQMIHYYGFYSILSLKLRQKENKDALIPFQSMEILFDPPHLTSGRIVEFNPYSLMQTHANGKGL
jgi:hypothetical protein